MMSETTAAALRSGRGLIENIIRFADLLRANGLAVSLPAALDAVQALPLIDISSRRTFQHLLQANLVCRKEDIPRFEQLFYAYWLPGNRSRLEIPGRDGTPGQEESDGLVSPALETRPAPRQPEATQASRDATMRYSPDSLPTSGEPLELRFEQSRILYESIAGLLRPMVNRLSRRYRYALHGREINLRRILRKNMQFGGELILLDFKKKKIKKRRVVFFCDVSGSMDIYTLMILQFIHALKRIERRTEIFLFSTELTRATGQFDAADFAAAVSELPRLAADWGGGTRIGHCLENFNKTCGPRLLAGRPVVLLFSDGWDRGQTELLASQMALLQRKAYKIIWLNPLAGARDYEPLCRGMRAALPYVDYFLPLGAPHDIHHLGRMLEKLISGRRLADHQAQQVRNPRLGDAGPIPDLLDDHFRQGSEP
jgi:uncharacterized protein with von Willebrand factor type A (vWA) domain